MRIAEMWGIFLELTTSGLRASLQRSVKRTSSHATISSQTDVYRKSLTENRYGRWITMWSGLMPMRTRTLRPSVPIRVHLRSSPVPFSPRPDSQGGLRPQPKCVSMWVCECVGQIFHSHTHAPTYNQPTINNVRKVSTQDAQNPWVQTLTADELRYASLPPTRSPAPCSLSSIVSRPWSIGGGLWSVVWSR
jgi:hypothetical protein